MSFADNLLVARNKELERQVTELRQLVLQSNRFLVDVHFALRAGGDPRALAERITGLTRRMEHLVDRQKVALEGNHSTDTSEAPIAYSSADVTAAAPMPARGSLAGAGKPASDGVDGTAAHVTERLLHASARIADSWLATKHKTVAAAMALPNDAFEEFDARPTDDSLHAFLAAYRDAVVDVDRVMQTVDDSPFRGPSKQRVADLYTSMLESILVQPVNASAAGNSNATATEAPTTTAPAAVQRGGASPSMARNDAPPPPLAPAGIGRQPLKAAGKPSQLLGPEPTPRRQISSELSAALLPSSGGAATPSPSAMSNASQTPRCSTPSRFYGAKHDSSQMHSIFGGDSQNNVARPKGSAGVSAEVATLQEQLSQLELQLSMASCRRESGSEAKYYSLNKKIQMVRAELLRVQRAEAEDQAIRNAVAQQQQQRARDASTSRVSRAFR